MTFGAFELFPLVDGYFRLDGGAMFGVVPKPLWSRRAPADERNRIRLGLRPLLVRGDRTVLIDAGIGGTLDPRSTDIYGVDRSPGLDRSLDACGVASSDVDVVVATHLHFDHVGGLTARRPDGRVVPAFPRARHLVRQGEWDDATSPHERNRASYIQENFVPLADAGLIDFHADDIEVVPGIRTVRTGGHTLHHELVRIESDGRTAVFAADLLPTTAHVDLPWIMGYDLYPMDTLTFKRAFLREAIDREYLIFFEHDPEIAAGYIREKNGRPYVEPLV